MNETSISINSNKLPIREYNGQRVVTFKDIDAVHGKTSGAARKRFNDNRNRFIEGVDYFVRKTDEAKKEFGVTAPNGLILITESGYLMLAKSFTDDLAWTVQRELVNNYFRVKSPEPANPKAPALETAEYHYFPKTLHGEPVITLDDFEYFTGVLHPTAYRHVKRLCKPDVDYLHLKGTDLFIYKIENRNVNKSISEVIILKSGAVRKLLKYFGLSVKIPMLEEKPVPLPAPRREYVPKREPSEEMKSLIERLHNEIKAIEGISYLLLYPDTKDNYENQREQLVNRIRALRDYSYDVSKIVIE